MIRRKKLGHGRVQMLKLTELPTKMKQQKKNWQSRKPILKLAERLGKMRNQ